MSSSIRSRGARTASPPVRAGRSAGPEIRTIPVPTPFPIGPVNVHLIASDPVTLVDTGPLSEDAWEALNAGLERWGLSIRDVRRVILTHGHQDHFGLATRIAEASGATLLGGRLDRARFGVYRSARMLLDDLARHGFGLPVRSMVALSVAGVDLWARPVERMEPLDGGEELPGDGYRIRVLFVPGHTPGSLAFEVPEAGVLFTGDTLLKDVTPNAIVDEDPERPGVLFRSVSRYFESLERIDAVAPHATLLTGHGGRIEDLGAHRRRLARRYQLRIEQIVRSLGGGPRSVRDLVQSLFPGLDPINVFLAFSEVLGFLMYLEDEKRVQAVPSAGRKVLYRLVS